MIPSWTQRKRSSKDCSALRSILTGTMDHIGPIMESIPGSAICRQLRSAQKKILSYPEVLASARAQAKCVMVEKVMVVCFGLMYFMDLRIQLVREVMNTRSIAG